MNDHAMQASLEIAREGRYVTTVEMAEIIQRVAVEPAVRDADELGRLAVQDYKRSQEQVRELAEALRRIQAGNGDHYCDCEHDDEDCCAQTDYFCPHCIAGVALAKVKA